MNAIHHHEALLNKSSLENASFILYEGGDYMATWKDIVHAYVNARNRAELDQAVEALESSVEDLQFLQMEKERHKRIRKGYDERNLQPVRNETRLKIESVSQSASSATVDLVLRRLFEYEQYGDPYYEERIERERLVLKAMNGRWRIERVAKNKEEASSKRHFHQKAKSPLSSPTAGSHPTASAVGHQRSQPYINQAVFERTRHATRSRSYDRQKAVQYADTWWDVPNPEYRYFDVNCTNFVSQCLYAGGAPMNYTGKRSSGWWYRHQHDGWSFSWSVSNSLYYYLVGNKIGWTAQAVNSPMELELGDVIIYDWDGDGSYQHSVVVTAFDANGMPLVNANTTNSRHRYWDYKDSYAWTEQTRYRFFHISSTF